MVPIYNIIGEWRGAMDYSSRERGRRSHSPDKHYRSSKHGSRRDSRSRSRDRGRDRDRERTRDRERSRRSRSRSADRSRHKTAHSRDEKRNKSRSSDRRISESSHRLSKSNGDSPKIRFSENSEHTTTDQEKETEYELNEIAKQEIDEFLMMEEENEETEEEKEQRLMNERRKRREEIMQKHAQNAMKQDQKQVPLSFMKRPVILYSSVPPPPSSPLPSSLLTRLFPLVLCLLE